MVPQTASSLSLLAAITSVQNFQNIQYLDFSMNIPWLKVSTHRPFSYMSDVCAIENAKVWNLIHCEENKNSTHSAVLKYYAPIFSYSLSE